MVLTTQHCAGSGSWPLLVHLLCEPPAPAVEMREGRSLLQGSTKSREKGVPSPGAACLPALCPAWRLQHVSAVPVDVLPTGSTCGDGLLHLALTHHWPPLPAPAAPCTPCSGPHSHCPAGKTCVNSGTKACPGSKWVCQVGSGRPLPCAQGSTTCSIFNSPAPQQLEPRLQSGLALGCAVRRRWPCSRPAGGPGHSQACHCNMLSASVP
jgi:hypothetical protein